MVQKNRYDHGLNGSVAAVIRGERAMADLTIQQLADRAGVNAQTLRRYLAMERAFDIETLDAVSVALGLSAAAVMSRAQNRLVAQSANQPDVQPGDQSTKDEVDEGVYVKVRGNKALGRALDRKASRDAPPSQDGQLGDSEPVNKRRRRA